MASLGCVIETCLRRVEYLNGFIGVFGPYDYVITFRVDNFVEVNQKIQEIRSKLKEYIAQIVTPLPVNRDSNG